MRVRTIAQFDVPINGNLSQMSVFYLLEFLFSLETFTRRSDTSTIIRIKIERASTECFVWVQKQMNGLKFSETINGITITININTYAMRLNVMKSNLLLAFINFQFEWLFLVF